MKKKKKTITIKSAPFPRVQILRRVRKNETIGTAEQTHPMVTLRGEKGSNRKKGEEEKQVNKEELS